MKRIVVWRRIDTVGVEYAEIEPEPLHLEGEVILIENGSRCAVAYRVACDDAMRTASATVHLRCEGAERECTLARSPGDVWTVNGALSPELHGLVDVDLSVTPSTNTPPIRRLRLAVGQRAEVTAAWVRFPALDVVPLRQIYRRVAANAYEYEAPDLPFSTTLECDEQGIIRTYEGLWTECS